MNTLVDRRGLNIKIGGSGVHAAMNAKKSPLQRECSSWMVVSFSTALGLEEGCGSEWGGVRATS